MYPYLSMFIVLDGPDATGTSTHTKFLSERLAAEGHTVLMTSEPTDGPIGKEIREYLKTGDIDPMELQLMFTMDRAWHVENVIEPALEAGKIVVSDRYAHSTIVYAEAQGLDTAKLRELNDAFVQPDLTFFTLPPIAFSLEKLGKRDEKDVFEKEDMQQRIHAGYLKMATENPSIHVIDTSRPKEVYAEEIWSIVQEKHG